MRLQYSNLMSKAVMANPASAAAVAIGFCEERRGQEGLSQHMIAELEIWASKYARESEAVGRHRILTALGLPDQPDVKLVQPGAATIDFK